jgi:hypothetical protein
MHDARDFEHCDPCKCKFALEDYPTSSSELNPAENAQNQLRQVVMKIRHDGEVKWDGNARTKMEVLRKYIAHLDSDKWVSEMMEHCCESRKKTLDTLLATLIPISFDVKSCTNRFLSISFSLLRDRG